MLRPGGVGNGRQGTEWTGWRLQVGQERPHETTRVQLLAPSLCPSETQTGELKAPAVARGHCSHLLSCAPL